MFFKEANEIDLGDTAIPNIFIDIFMPMANGVFVKVYLLGYKQANDSDSNPKFNNESIAKNLSIPLSDVVDAWSFWESKNIVVIHKNDGIDDFNFSIEFLDLKKLYTNNIMPHTSSIKSNSDSIVSEYEDLSIRKMFNSINKIIGRYLEPSEKVNLMEIRRKFNMSTDMVVYAYENVKENTGTSKPVRYIESILRNWYDSNFYAPQDVAESLAYRSERYALYKTVFNELGFSRNPSNSEKQIIDEWFNKYNMDIELVLEACSKSKNTSNPSVSYINGVIKSWYDKGIKDLNDLKKSEEEYKAKKANKTTNSKNYNNQPKSTDYKKTKFHNFEETFTKYTSDELDEIIEKSQREKFK